MTAIRPRLRVSVGQHWCLTAGFMGGRIRVRIDAIDGKFAQATVIPSGRSMRIDIHTLERQHRGATLELEADGGSLTKAGYGCAVKAGSPGELAGCLRRTRIDSQ